MSNNEGSESEDEVVSSEQHSAIELRTDSSISDSENEREYGDDDNISEDDDLESETSESEHHAVYSEEGDEENNHSDDEDMPSRKRSRSSRSTPNTETYRLGRARRQSNSSLGEEEDAGMC